MQPCKGTLRSSRPFLLTYVLSLPSDAVPNHHAQPEVGLILVIEREISTRGQEQLLKGLWEVPQYQSEIQLDYAWFRREHLSGPMRSLAAKYGVMNGA